MPNALAEKLFRMFLHSKFRDTWQSSAICESQFLLPSEELIDVRFKAHAAKVVENIARKLSASGRNLEDNSAVGSENETWGLVITQRAPMRKIHRGFLEPVRHLPIVENIPDRVAMLFMQFPGGRDFLQRDIHHPGVHYHYLSHQRTRSDVILSWDTRWTSPQAGAMHPLFWEKHGEGRNKFRAKPEQWGCTKRTSAHKMCAPDLKKWPLKEFRCASNDASAVWPDDATITRSV